MNIRQLVKILLVPRTHAYMSLYFPLSETYFNETISFRETSSTWNNANLYRQETLKFHHNMTPSFSYIR